MNAESIPTLQRQLGASRLAVFFALWSLALVVLHDVRVIAAPAPQASAAAANLLWAAAPAPVPELRAGLFEDIELDVAPPVHKRAGHVAAPRASVAADAAAARTHVELPISVAVVPQRIRTEASAEMAESRIASHLVAGDYAGAANELKLAREAASQDAPRLRVLQARLAVEQGDSQQAYATLMENLPDIRGATAHYDLLAAVMVRLGRDGEAAQVYRALLSIDRSNARWWAGLAVSLQRSADRTAGHSADKGEQIAALHAVQNTAPHGSQLAVWASQRLGGMT